MQTQTQHNYADAIETSHVERMIEWPHNSYCKERKIIEMKGFGFRFRVQCRLTRERNLSYFPSMLISAILHRDNDCLTILTWAIGIADDFMLDSGSGRRQMQGQWLLLLLRLNENVGSMLRMLLLLLLLMLPPLCCLKNAFVSAHGSWSIACFALDDTLLQANLQQIGLGCCAG